MRYVSRQEMQAIDQAATHEYHIPALTLMENAGREAANFFAAQVPHASGRILFLCGKGNNGGDALIAARYLAQKGFKVQILLLSNLSQMTDEARIQFQKVQNMPNVSTCGILLEALLKVSDYIIDGLFGIGLTRPLEGKPLEWIRAVNHSKLPVLALDIPSGMDADTGDELPECIRASWTITFGLPKKAFQNPEALAKIGTLIVTNVGFPAELLD